MLAGVHRMQQPMILEDEISVLRGLKGALAYATRGPPLAGEMVRVLDAAVSILIVLF